MTRFRFVHDHQDAYPVKRLGELVACSRSGFYGWRDRPLSDHYLADVDLAAEIFEIHVASQRTYGTPRILRQLQHRNRRVGRKRVARIMADSQYTSLEFGTRLDDWNVTPSFGRTGGVLGQRRHGIDLGHDQTRNPRHPRRLDPHDQITASHRPVRLHRNVLQLPPPPSTARPPNPQRGLHRLRQRGLNHRNTRPRERVYSMQRVLVTGWFLQPIVLTGS